MTDSLTGLSNRRRLLMDLDELTARASSTHPCALIMFDLDGFKAYNDRFGHPVGDALLARLGRNLAASVAGSGRGYRLGGDEFCVVACGRREELSALAATAHSALRDTGRGFEISSSFGMVLVPDEAPDTEHALNLADERLYEHKGESRRTTVTRETSDALVAVLKECQPALDGHLNEVAKLAREVGSHMGLRPGELDDITRAAQLHDIGKVAVPSDILDKHGPLDETEWDFVRQHTLVGDRILSAAPAMSAVAEVVRASHERFDGAGYPDGLAGGAIPLGARIVAVCDAYHAMTGGRPYRAAVEPDAALHELRRCSGAQFDPEVVDAFCDLLVPAPAG
jgi:diguanylate cyclase (GGDEF)-like protein